MDNEIYGNCVIMNFFMIIFWLIKSKIFLIIFVLGYFVLFM